MAKCPKCKEKISYLLLEGRAYSELLPDGAYGDEESDFDGCEDYICPKCGFLVAEGEKDALTLLQKDNPNNPHCRSGIGVF